MKIFIKLFAVFVMLNILSGCATKQSIDPIIAYKTQNVNIPVLYCPTPPVVEAFVSAVDSLPVNATDGELVKAWKLDMLVLRNRDKMFTFVLDKYKEVSQNSSIETNKGE